MKTVISTLIFCFLLFTFFELKALNPPKLKTGLYKITDKSQNKLRLDDKTYFVEDAPICTVKNFKSIEVHLVNVRKDIYALEIKLDEKGTESLKKATEVFLPDELYIGFVIKGKLIAVPRVFSQITKGELNFAGNYSQQKLEQIRDEIKAEMQH